MAIEKKRMQQRGGPYNQFDKSKTLPKEFQFVNSGDPNTSDGRAIYATFESGDPKRLSTYEDMSNDLALALAGLEEEYLGSITQATQNAINATSQASSAATAANQAADEANEIIDAFKEAVDGTVISDSSPSSSTAYSSQKIENVFLKKSGDGSNVTVTFQQAADRAGIQSGDSLAVAFGKLAKFCADIQDYVFSPPVASLASTDATRPLAASMGKRLNDDFTAKYNNLNSALETKQDEFYTSVAPLNEVPFAIQKNMVLISNQIDGANNKSGYFSITDDNRSEWIGLSGLMPQSGTFIGFREVFVKTGTSGSEHIMAKITEMYPLCGRQYFNFYNHGSWVGWTVITPAS